MKIAVLTSGGVDSSVALKLLQNQGHDVTAFYLKIWLEDELSFLGENCPWDEDLKYLRAICDKNKITLEVISMQKEYFDTVVTYTIKEVKDGRTPNPDVMCNNNVKFGLFLKKISKSFEKIATGHYAEIYKKSGIYYLKKTPDPIKDQTYFLSNLKQKQLARLIFPLGKLKKEEVRKLAKKFDLPNQDRKDSQGICFLGKFKYSDFIKHYLGTKKGDLIEYETNKKLATHEGFWYYTIGQRKGIKLSGGPWFVVKKDTRRNVVYISSKYHDANKKRNTFKIGNFNWFSRKIPSNTKQLRVKLRHGENSYKCTIKKLSKTTAQVKISGNDHGIAPGQFAAFYSGKVCLGSALILA